MLRVRRARDERGQDDVGGAMARPARFGAVLVVVFALLLATAAWAQDAKPTEPPQEPPALTEVEALRMEVLHHRRQAMEQRLIAIRLEGEALPAKIADLARQLDAVIEEAAKRAGLSLKDGWRPNPDTRRWQKP